MQGPTETTCCGVGFLMKIMFIIIILSYHKSGPISTGLLQNWDYLLKEHSAKLASQQQLCIVGFLLHTVKGTVNSTLI